MALLGERFKYYFAWKIAEGSSVLAGFGFEGYTTEKDGKVVPKGWRGVENIEIISFETAANIQTLSRSWNKRTQGWLERYTYSRTGNNLYATYFVSAIWHGLYPGFFFFFMSVPLLTQIERLARTKINPIFLPGYDGRNPDTAPKGIVATLYWTFCRVATLLATNYIVQTFSVGSYENSMTCWGSYKHVPHIIYITVIVLLTVIPAPKSNDGEKKKK